MGICVFSGIHVHAYKNHKMNLSTITYIQTYIPFLFIVLLTFLRALQNYTAILSMST